jgi:ABC-type transport system involved in multi-copper enzyme maturation permease subunit
VSVIPGSTPSTTTVEPVTLRRTVTSEWIKFRTLRSTLAVLALALAGMLVIGLIVAYNTRHLSPSLQPNDIVASSPLQGYYLGQLLIGALGVLLVTGEFSSGMIRSTLTLVPRRLPVLWAKLLVFVTVTAVPLIVMSLLSFTAAEALISHSRPGISLSSPGALRVVIGTGLYLTLVGLIGAAVGWIVRSTPGSLVAYLAIVLVIPVLFGNAFGAWGKQVAKFLPSQAGGAFISIIPDGPSLRPWLGLVVLVAWVVAFTAVAAVTLRQRDV